MVVHDGDLVARGRNLVATETVSQAESIRRYVLVHHVKPARATGIVELTIRAGDVCRGMRLHDRTPNVCSVLGSRKFLEMARLRLLDRVGPQQSTTTTFHYALVGSPTGVPSTRAALPGASKASRKEQRAGGVGRRVRVGDSTPTVVIQCAGTKAPSAGHLALESGRRVKFVADPKDAPKDRSMSYRRPDDPAFSGMSWREVLVEYNQAPVDNRLNLLPAWTLYEPRACPRLYAELAEAYGVENVFILSAGWGLVAADFLLPDYDITFSNQAASYKRRRKRDRYEDFSMLPTDLAGPIVFLGGTDYVALFCSLTRDVEARRIVFHYSGTPPRAMNCELRRFEAASPRNWHYECANALIRGQIRVA